jgi:hypothetical protein
MAYHATQSATFTNDNFWADQLYDVDANDFQYPRNLQDEHLKQYWLQEKEDLRCMGLGGAGVEQEIELLDSFLRWSLRHSSWGYWSLFRGYQDTF